MIVAIDPGQTTGLVEFDPDLKEFICVQQFKTNVAKLYNTLFAINPSHVVCEAFQYQNRGQRIDLFPRELIGVTKLYCHNNGATLSLQQASHAKKLWPTYKLKELGLWESNKQHAMDAIRHLLYFVTVEQKDNYFVNQLKE